MRRDLARKECNAVIVRNSIDTAIVKMVKNIRNVQLLIALAERTYRCIRQRAGVSSKKIASKVSQSQTPILAACNTRRRDQWNSIIIYYANGQFKFVVVTAIAACCVALATAVKHIISTTNRIILNRRTGYETALPCAVETDAVENAVTFYFTQYL